MSDKYRRLIDTLIVELKRYSTIDGFVGSPADIGKDWGEYLSTYDPEKYATRSPRDLAMALIFYETKKYQRNVQRGNFQMSRPAQRQGQTNQQGGYNPNQQQNYNPNQQGGYNPNQQQQQNYNPNQQGSYNPNPNQQQQGFNPNQQQQGFNPNQQQQGFNPNQQGSYNPNQQQQGFNPNQQGSYNPNQQGSYNPNQQGSYNPNQQQQGFNPNQQQQGFNPNQQQQGFNPDQQQQGFNPNQQQQQNQPQQGPIVRYEPADFCKGELGYNLVMTHRHMKATTVNDTDLILMATLKKYIDYVYNFIKKHPELFREEQR